MKLAAGSVYVQLAADCRALVGLVGDAARSVLVVDRSIAQSGTLRSLPHRDEVGIRSSSSLVRYDSVRGTKGLYFIGVRLLTDDAFTSIAALG